MWGKKGGVFESPDLGDGLGKAGGSRQEREKATHKWGRGATAGP